MSVPVGPVLVDLNILPHSAAEINTANRAYYLSIPAESPRWKAARDWAEIDKPGFDPYCSVYASCVDAGLPQAWARGSRMNANPRESLPEVNPAEIVEIARRVRMPIYEFRCTQCGHIQEIIVAGNDGEVVMACEECRGEDMERVLSRVSYSMGSSGPSRSGGASLSSTTRDCGPGRSCTTLELPGHSRS